MKETTETKHTQGGWSLRKVGACIDLVGNCGNKVIASWDVANDGVAYQIDEEDEANMALLSNVPSLLAENRRLREALDNLQQLATKMLAGGYNGKMKEMHTALGNSCATARAALATKESVDR